MTDGGRLVVYRPPSSWRANRGVWDVRIDGGWAGRLPGGGEIASSVGVGRHRVQVGRVAMSTRGEVFWGSPELVVEVGNDEVRVRVEPSGIPVARQVNVSGSALRLVVEGGPSHGQATPLPDRVSHGYLGLLMRMVADRPHPYRTWQGALSLFILAFGVVVVVFGLVFAHHRTAGSWFGIAFFGLAAVGSVRELHTILGRRGWEPDRKAD